MAWWWQVQESKTHRGENTHTNKQQAHQGSFLTFLVVDHRRLGWQLVLDLLVEDCNRLHVSLLSLQDRAGLATDLVGRVATHVDPCFVDSSDFPLAVGQDERLTRPGHEVVDVHL